MLKAVEKLKGPNCKAEVEATDNFCTHCGTRLKKTCNCWVKKKDSYDCGESSCPGLKLLIPEPGRRAASVTDKIGLGWLGKMITHKDAGRGIVIGYSSKTGEPCAYFYSGEYANRIYYFSHKDVVGVAESFERSHCEQEETKSQKNRAVSVKLEVDSSELDAAIEKARDLIQLGEDVQTRGIFNLDDKLHFIDKEIWPKILIMNLATFVITCINIVLVLARG